ncbi:THUMP domain-containing class I SAM-dependent RNA methyltransferase [Sneathiella glossodoripedis]|uniref:THUMP domain-containing class I SAM-dependent RNA methyltransferase n=1 Tax=Sneathiella glossodoripedis TaxID=418853 RepID=UPI000472B7DC|nr:THUMP domain-containing protein [Sneathiella glossodoripedis]
MNNAQKFEILLVTPPGLEQPLRAEAIELGFKKPHQIKGGVTIEGSWQDIWRANLEMRGASRILVRLGDFHVNHLAELDKKARKFPWSDFFHEDIPLRVDVSCKKSKIYHQKAARERIERAITEELNAPVSKDAELTIKVRIFENLCTISVDSSGEGLHIRNHKEALNRAPMRETMAALLLRKSSYKGKEPVVDPMCGSGTFVLEAAEIAKGLKAGRNRRFAFEQLKSFDATEWETLKSSIFEKETRPQFYGFDRDAGAIKIANANAKRAGVADLTHFSQQTISELICPEDEPETGLVIVNPPYGIRIGEEKQLLPLYQTLGRQIQSNFKGWRFALVTNSHKLAKATGLTFDPTVTTFSHGGINVRLYTASI